MPTKLYSTFITLSRHILYRQQPFITRLNSTNNYRLKNNFRFMSTSELPPVIVEGEVALMEGVVESVSEVVVVPEGK